MAKQAGGLVQDQNLNVRFDVAPLVVKSSVSKAQKQGGLVGRKALNDISNSGRPSTRESNKHKSKNVISVGEDFGLSELSSFGGKTNVSKAPKKAQVGGRTALGDVTNAGKSHVHQEAKKNLVKNLCVIAEEQVLPRAIEEEQFLHNHKECTNAQMKVVDIDYFLKTIGLDDENSMSLASPRAFPLSRKFKIASPPSRYLEMEEMSVPQWKRSELPSEQTPCRALQSPMPDVQLNEDYYFPNFKLAETPELLKH